MARTDCTLVTCDAFPALDPDDRLLAGELRRRGMRVAIAVWSDPAVDWSAGRLTVLRSTWDYHRRHAEFVAWLDRIASLTTVRNAPPLIKWNAHKFYLRDLELRGIPVVPTAWLTQGTRCRLAELCASRGWDSVVIKPALGAASHDVIRTRASLDEAQAHLDALLAGEDALVQPYLQSVETYGERALMFVRDRYWHAVAKEPFDTVLAVSDDRSKLATATAEEIALAQKALRAVPGTPLYARVDLLRDDAGNALISEVELIEPGLYFGIHPPAVRGFADAVAAELEAAPTLA